LLPAAGANTPVSFKGVLRMGCMLPSPETPITQTEQMRMAEKR